MWWFVLFLVCVVMPDNTEAHLAVRALILTEWWHLPAHITPIRNAIHAELVGAILGLPPAFNYTEVLW